MIDEKSPTSSQPVKQISLTGDMQVVRSERSSAVGSATAWSMVITKERPNFLKHLVALDFVDIPDGSDPRQTLRELGFVFLEQVHGARDPNNEHARSSGRSQLRYIRRPCVHRASP